MAVAPALLLLLAAQSAAPAPQAAVLLTRRVDLPRVVAQEVVRAVSDAVAAQGIAVAASNAVAAQKARAAAEACAGRSACVLEAGHKLAADVVVGVQVGSLGSTVAVYVEARRVSDGEKLAEHNAAVPNDKLRAIPGIEGFARSLKEALAPPPAPPPAPPAPPPPALPPSIVVQAPTVPPADPGRVPAEAVAAPAAPPSGHLAGKAFTAVAAVTAAGAVACLASGLALKQPLAKDADGHIDLLYPEAASRRDTVNALLVSSAVAGGVAVLAGGTALLVW